MTTFSEHFGYKGTYTAIQFEQMDDALRTALWNVLQRHCWSTWDDAARHSREHRIRDAMNTFTELMWFVVFETPTDSRSVWWKDNKSTVRQHFFAAEWNEVYDIVQFTSEHYPFIKERAEAFRSDCNLVLKHKAAGWQLGELGLVPITSELELASIEEAAGGDQVDAPASEHIREAVRMLSDRPEPNYRRSIKESISAVESASIGIAGDGADSYRSALRSLTEDRDIHPALREAFNKLYGYTSDEGGIRHALLGPDEVEFEEAKFMLVACSAFVNYLQGKTASS